MSYPVAPDDCLQLLAIFHDAPGRCWRSPAAIAEIIPDAAPMPAYGVSTVQLFLPAQEPAFHRGLLVWPPTNAFWPRPEAVRPIAAMLTLRYSGGARSEVAGDIRAPCRPPEAARAGAAGTGGNPGLLRIHPASDARLRWSRHPEDRGSAPLSRSCTPGHAGSGRPAALPAPGRVCTRSAPGPPAPQRRHSGPVRSDCACGRRPDTCTAFGRGTRTTTNCRRTPAPKRRVAAAPPPARLHPAPRPTTAATPSPAATPYIATESKHQHSD